MNDEDDNIAMYYDTYIVSYLPMILVARTTPQSALERRGT